ncbi:MAG: glycosyltransferase [Candidatus Marinimicrobia bacterium]|nr:glycosyltransferase [Candidatus Neomarinimicrobiota bacterium]
MMELILTLNLIFLLIYAISLSKLSSGLKKLRLPKKEDSKDSVSILISLHNEEGNIPGLLDSLSALTYPKAKFEVIFINDRSKDRTDMLLKQACSNNSNYEYIGISETPKGWGPKKYAVTKGVEKSKGSIILLTDADGRPQVDWIQSMLGFFHSDTGMVLGYAPYENKGTISSHLIRLEYFSQASIAAASTGMGNPATCVGTNLAYRKKVFTDLKGYGKFKHTVSGDDDLFLSRVRNETKWKINYAYSQSAHISNEAPKSWKKFYHQRLRFASKSFKYPLKMILVLMLFYFFNVSMIAMGLLLFSNPVFWKIATLLFLFKVSSEYRFLRNTADIFGDTHRWRLMIPASFLHIVYVLYFGAASQFLSWKWIKD